MPYLGNSPQQSVRQRYHYTATAGQTTFSGTDIYGLILKYEDNEYVDVYLNGVLLQKIEDYTATSRTSVVLASGAQVGDLVEIVVYGVFSVSDTVSASRGGTFTNAINVSSNLVVSGNVNVSSDLAVTNNLSANIVRDSHDNLRSVPINNQTTSYILTTTDNGKTVSTNSNITINGPTLLPNQVFSIYNNSSSTITITSGANTTIYLAGTSNTGNRSLSQRGIATLQCVAANTFVITGGGLF